MFKQIHKKNFKRLIQGFTVIELMVTITIVVLVTGIIMVQYSSFNSSVLLTSEAYLMAFDLREAQSLAVSVRGQSDEFREEYGIYFDITADNPNQYLLFQDDNYIDFQDPAHYDFGEQVGVPYAVNPQFVISNICATNSSSRTCYADDPSTTGEVVNTAFHDLAVTFQRPDFDAAFYSNAKTSIQSMDITIQARNSTLQKKVTVYSTGQISIK